MKKVILSALLLTFFSGVRAQDSETGLLRVNVMGGLYTTKDIHTAIVHQFGEGVWGTHNSFTYFMDFSFYRTDIIEVGISLGYQEAGLRHNTRDPFFNNDNLLSIHYYTFLPQIRFNWIYDDSIFELYSGVGLGLTMVDAQYRDRFSNGFYPLPAIHLNWIGMRLGRDFGGFMELGLGTKGLISGGISYRM